MDKDAVQRQLQQIRTRVIDQSGGAALAQYPSLRHIDPVIRELKFTLQQWDGPGATLLRDLEEDPDLTAFSRRIRLEMVRNYCDLGLRILDSGLQPQTKTIYRAPNTSALTSMMPGLKEVIDDRWLEVQKCQHAKAYLSAVIVMGSILEGLLLARMQMDLPSSHRSAAAPKDRSGTTKPITEWSLSQLIDVAVDLRWVKEDRGRFSHSLRESRNVVHPWAQLSRGVSFDEATCRVCWEVLRCAVDDLLGSVAP